MMLFLRDLVLVIMLTAIAGYGLPAVAAPSIRSAPFSLQATDDAPEAYGQIDWPRGKLKDWKGPVIVMVLGGYTSDRDGWSFLVTEKSIGQTGMLRTLSDALVAKGLAVVRFDNYGVYPPSFGCRHDVEQNGLNDENLRNKCVDVMAKQFQTVERHVNFLTRIIDHARAAMPKSRNRIVLFAFSEGVLHSAEIVRRGSHLPLAVVSIGGPAERVDELRRWQLVDREIETLAEFDLDGDGVITNEEIALGYKNGIGHISPSVELWLSPTGRWTEDALVDWRKSVESAYRSHADANSEVKGRLYWIPIGDNAVLAPEMTDSFRYMGYWSKLSSLEEFSRAKVPSLYIYGERDTQVPAARQVKLIEQSRARGDRNESLVLPNGYHMLSTTELFGSIEPEFVPRVASTIRDFVDRAARTGSRRRVAP